jgi:uncharacterized protein related to proFAR isomerase
MSDLNSLINLPIGIQTFEHVIGNNCLYVDKTDYLARIIENTTKPWFFSRPRRFGKSLTVSTLEAIFSGKKELFKGLAIEKRLDEPMFAARPVIYLDMSSVTTNRGVDVVEQSLVRLTLRQAKMHGLEIDSHIPPGEALYELISECAQRSSCPVAVLVDEYDKPFLDFFHKPEEAEQVREAMRSYYIQLKAADRYISFIFITGISKFSRMGVFSALNNITDISINTDFGAMCGYTHEELIRYFDRYIDAATDKLNMAKEDLLKKVRDYYDGFCFDGQTMVYNPFSTLQFFKDQRFNNYWFESGTASFIAQYLKDHCLTVEQFRGLPVDSDFARNPGELDAAPPESFLYQSGYLSLRPGEIDDEYTLDYPNREVLKSMSSLLIGTFVGNFGGAKKGLLRALLSGDCQALVEEFNSLLAAIPYDDYVAAIKKDEDLKRKIKDLQKIIKDLTFGEWLYRSTLLSFLIGAGLDVEAEVHSSHGRADLVVKYKDRTWVMEIKISQSAAGGQEDEELAEVALNQILEKGYAAPYDQAIILGLVINDPKRSITAWKILP